MKVRLDINGETCELEVSPSTSLNEALREIIGLTGTKRGCDSGGCGTCTVLLDNKPVFSCMTPCWRAEGKRVLTVEGLTRDGKLNHIQESFVENYAPQCGYCTPAMLLVAEALLDSNPHPTEEQIRYALSGVLCRCTGYTPYLRAIMQVAESKISGGYHSRRAP